jgi:hypothetical protein
MRKTAAMAYFKALSLQFCGGIEENHENLGYGDRLEGRYFKIPKLWLILMRINLLCF